VGHLSCPRGKGGGALLAVKGAQGLSPLRLLRLLSCVHEPLVREGGGAVYKRMCFTAVVKCCPKSSPKFS